MTPRTRFKSFLGPDVKQFLAHKRSLGRRYDVEEKTLALLDAYLLQKRISRISEVTPTLVDEFLLSRPRPRARSYNHLRCTIGRFFSYLVDRGKLAATPLQSPPRRSRYERTPFIFDMAAAQRLLALAKTLPNKGGTMERGSTYFVLFAVLYGLGLRVGEACRLRIKDVDRERQLLVIRETKSTRAGSFPLVPSSKRCLSSMCVGARRRTRAQPGMRPRCSACVGDGLSISHCQPNLSCPRSRATSGYCAECFVSASSRSTSCLCCRRAHPLVPPRP